MRVLTTSAVGLWPHQEAAERPHFSTVCPQTAIINQKRDFKVRAEKQEDAGEFAEARKLLPELRDT